MRRRILLLALAAALVPGLAACGEEGGEEGGGELPAEEFASRADALCDSFAKENRRPPEPDNAKQAGRFAKEEADQRVRLQEQLTDIGPPDGAKADFDTYAEQTQQIIELFEDQVIAAEKGDSERFSASFAEIDTLTAERAQTAERLGFQTCGQPGLL